MAFIDIFTLVVLAIAIISGLGVFVIMGMLPGKIAHQRNHPQAEAINVASWVFLLLGFAIWPFVLVWAYIDIGKPSTLSESASSLHENTSGGTK